MTDLSSDDPRVLLARSAALKLYVVLRRTRNGDQLRALLPNHLRWMIGHEREGRIFLSGPTTGGTDQHRIDGLTIVRADSLQEAEELVRGDPFVSAGAVEVELCEWTVNEGSIPIVLTLSDSAVSFR